MGGSNKLFPFASFAFITILATAGFSMVYAQADPFEVGGGYSPGESQSNTTLQIRSNTDWSGTYGDSTGSTTVDGHGNKDFIFSCSSSYSAVFQKKGEGPGFLTLNIVEPFNNTVTKFQDIIKHGVPLVAGGSVVLTKHITDLHDNLYFSIISASNSSSNAVNTNQPFNSTFRLTITDPDGSIMLRNDTPPISMFDSLAPGDSYTFFPTLKAAPLTPHIPGEYGFTVKNLGNSTGDLNIEYGSSPSQTTITTHNVTNTRTTTAQFGTVSVSGSC
jgi:hypothetical protein